MWAVTILGRESRDLEIILGKKGFCQVLYALLPLLLLFLLLPGSGLFRFVFKNIEYFSLASISEYGSSR